nr:MAG TPA: hypothetical protein [Bacteriophage sp.]
MSPEPTPVTTAGPGLFNFCLFVTSFDHKR